MNAADQQVERSNYRNLVLDIAWFGLALAATTRFMQFFAIRMGATPMELGLLTAIPAAVLILSTSLSHAWRQRCRDTVQSIWLPGIVFRLVFLLPVFAPFFPEGLRVPWIIASATLPAIAQGLSGVLFVVMMRETIYAERLGPLLAHRALAMNITITIGALAFGLLLEALPFPLNYQIMFAVAFLFAMVSQIYLYRLRTLAPVETHPPKAPARPLRELLREPGFQSVAFVTMITHLAYFMVFAVVPLRLERDLGATEGFIALFGVAELLAGALVTFVVHRVVRRIGYRTLIAWGLVGLALAALIIALSPVLWLTLVGAALTGSSWTAVALIGIFGFYVEHTRADDLQASRVFHQLTFLATFIGPLVGTLLVSGGLSIVTVLLLSVAVRLLGAYLVKVGLAAFRPRRYALSRR